jgi:hypothetical protein
VGANGGGFTEEQYLKIKEIARVAGQTGDFTAKDVLSSAIQVDPSINIGVVEAVLDALTAEGHLRRLPGMEPARWEVYKEDEEPKSPA